MKGMEKIEKVMGEFKRGTLRSGSGGMVGGRKQAIAIALSEARKAGARIPKKGISSKHSPMRKPWGELCKD